MCRLIGVSLAVTALAVGAFAGPLDSPKSDFARGPEGWEVRGPAAGPMWESGDGNPAPSISAVGLEGRSNWYWRAPAKYYGNRTAFYGRTLRYDLRSSSLVRDAKDDLILQGNGVTLVYDDRPPESPLWVNHTVMLRENADWKKRTAAQRVPATRGDFLTVLGGLNDLEIRGGTGEAIGPVYLDNVGVNQPLWARSSMVDSRLLIPTGALALVLLAVRARRRGTLTNQA